MQDDYFILIVWLYFSPFMCDLRGWTRVWCATSSFAIMHGKSSLIETLMVSMFGSSFTVDKSEFTKARLRALQAVPSAFRWFLTMWDALPSISTAKT